MRKCNERQVVKSDRFLLSFIVGLLAFVTFGFIAVSYIHAEQIVYFPLDTNPGWSTQGQWAFGVPLGQGGMYYGRHDPASGATGTNVYGVNLAGDYGLDVGYPYYLTAGPLNISGYENIKLQFKRWLNSDYQPFAYATVEVSSDSNTWTEVWNNGGSEIADSAWTLCEYDLSSVADGNPAIYIRWGYQVADYAWPYSGWNIDDINLTGSLSPDPAFIVTPSQGFGSAGNEGGPFAPVSKNYTLKNFSPNSLDWTAEVNVPWLSVEPNSGSLLPSQSAVVTVSINADANSLAIGSYNTGVKFTNLTSNINQVRPVTLLVQASDGPIGWVTMSDGNVPYDITGGSTGTTVIATDEASFKAYATSLTHYVILVPTTITMPRGTSSSNTPQTVNLQSNKTIIGIGSNPGIIGGFNISGKSNIIIRNMNISYVDSTFQGSADPWTDGITIQNGSHHIWVDHCNIFDSPDGLCDPTKHSNYITISWCKFYYTKNGDNTAHRNCCLVGSDDGDYADRGTLKETFHHNWWGNGCKERMPRVRFGKVHVFNNYYGNLQSGGYCQGVGVECQIKVENNYYNAVPLPWKDYSQAGIQGMIGWNTGNVFYNCSIPSWAPNDYYNIFTPPYSYTLDAGEDVKDIVRLGAGVNPDGDLTPPSPDPLGFDIAPYAAGDSSITMVAATAVDIHGVEYYFICETSGGHDSGWQDSNTYTDTGLLPSTTYYYTVKTRDKSSCQNESTTTYSSISATTFPDATAPTPNPITFYTEPYALSDTSIDMRAYWATDFSGVEYYFTNITDTNHNSGWQDSATYYDTGLLPGTVYTYTVKVRDKSAAHNETAASSPASATTFPDIVAPTPNPMTFGSLPFATSSTSIVLTAVTATDLSGVEYYFANITDANHYSGWQDSRTYTDVNLLPSTIYYYKVKARDKSINHNETDWSDEAWTTTLDDTTPPTPNPMTWEVAPIATGSDSITMTATTATDVSGGVEYYFMNLQDGAHDSDWVSSPSWTDTGLAKNTTYTYIVFAQDKNYNCNDPSNEASAATLNYDCSSHIASDLDTNCQVDFLDYYIMANTWTGDWHDMLQFAEDWLKCNRIPAEECWQ